MRQDDEGGGDLGGRRACYSYVYAIGLSYSSIDMY